MINDYKNMKITLFILLKVNIMFEESRINHFKKVARKHIEKYNYQSCRRKDIIKLYNFIIANLIYSFKRKISFDKLMDYYHQTSKVNRNRIDGYFVDYYQHKNQYPSGSFIVWQFCLLHDIDYTPSSIKYEIQHNRKKLLTRIQQWNKFLDSEIKVQKIKYQFLHHKFLSFRYVTHKLKIFLEDMLQRIENRKH